MKLLKSVISVAVIVISCSRFSHQTQKITFRNDNNMNTEEIAGDECNTPNGGKGECIRILDCPHLLALIAVPDQREFLGQSRCGWDGDIPLVCCSKEAPTSTKRTCTTSDLHWCSDPLDQCCIPELSYNMNEHATTDTTADQATTSQCEASSVPPEPSSGCCGQESSDHRIIRDTALLDQYPWAAIIEYAGYDTIEMKCGGAFISARYVLSAAHCLFFDNWTPINIRLGDFDIDHSGIDCVKSETGEDCSDGAVVILIEKSIPHPEYIVDSRVQVNDIALIRMNENAPYTDFIKPICLPSTNDFTQTANSSVKLYVAGWGLRRGVQTYSQLKQQAKIKFVTEEKCLMAYAQLNLILDEGQICAGGEKDKRFCKADSGSALMLKNDQSTEIVGVASFPCGRANRPAVYTKVLHYVSWIRSIVNIGV